MSRQIWIARCSGVCALPIWSISTASRKSCPGSNQAINSVWTTRSTPKFRSAGYRRGGCGNCSSCEPDDYGDAAIFGVKAVFVVVWPLIGEAPHLDDLFRTDAVAVKQTARRVGAVRCQFPIALARGRTGIAERPGVG